MKSSLPFALLLTSLGTTAHAQGLPRETFTHFGSAFIIEDQGFQKELKVKYKPTDTDSQAWTMLTGQSLVIKQTGTVEGKPVLIIEYQPDSYKPDLANVLIWSNGKQWKIEDPYLQLSKRDCMGLTWEIAADTVDMKAPPSNPDKIACSWTPSKGFQKNAAWSASPPKP